MPVQLDMAPLMGSGVSVRAPLFDLARPIGYNSSMRRLAIVLLLTSLTATQAFAVVVAPRISDREIVEGLANIRGDIKRLESTIKDFKESNDKRFVELREDMNKRFEQMDKRFEQMFTFLWMIVGIFTTMTVSVIGFAYWDRRTIIAKAKEETIAEIEKDGKVKNLVSTFRELAKSDSEVAKVLRQFNLL